MAWFDNLFAPPMFGQSAGLAPNSYDMFRALYPPHTRPMPEQPQMPYAPPMNPAMRMPQRAPNPIEPQLGGASTEGVLPAGWTPELIMPAAKAMMGTIPGIGPVMRGNMDSEVANRDPIRVNKPNVMPASNPPPMMGRAGELPPGVNPPGAMGMGDLAYPGAMTMPNAQSAAPKPGFWERNADTLGPDGKLWGPLAALGRGMSQPSWYGPMGQLSQGLGEATQAAQTGPMQRAQRRLLEAQVGKAEAETEQRTQWKSFLSTLPSGHPLKAYGAFLPADKIVDKIFAKPGEGMVFDIASGGWKVDPEWLRGAVEKAKAGKPDVTVNAINKMTGEAEGIDKLAAEYRARANAATDPQEKARLTARADAYERQATIGSKEYPEKLRQQAVELGTGTTAAANLATLLNNPDISRLNFNDRAAIAQQFQNLNLAYATLKNRGANFTESEQKMIAALAGGDPNAWTNMALRSRQDFIKKLETAHREMSAEWDRIKQAFARGEPMITPFPQFNTAPANRPNPGKIDRLGRDGNWR